MKVYFKRDGSEVQGATNLKHFNDLNVCSNVEYIEFNHVLRMLSLGNIVAFMQAVLARMAPDGEVYIIDTDAQVVANKVKFQHITLEDFNNTLFQQGNASCIALYWLKMQLEQMGFQTVACGYGFNNDFWIRVMK